MFAKKQGLYESSKIMYIPVDKIHPNPDQPRKFFDMEELKELSASIRNYGVIQPLSVRRIGQNYMLIAGERRLRASRMAGLTEVPCILLDADENSSSLIALIENLQRSDLDFIEEASAIERLIKIYGLSQEEAARRLSLSQSAVANKLRLLRHPPEIIEILRRYGFTERHARALLRIESIPDRIAAAEFIGENGLNVAESEKYIDKLLSKKETPPQRHKPLRKLYIIKDIRLFLNTIDRAISMMKQAGVRAAIDKNESDSDITLTIRIAKRV